MNRKLDRSYFFTAREVNEIIVSHLKAKDIPAPQYVGDTPNCTWTMDEAGVRVSWVDEDDVDLHQ